MKLLRMDCLTNTELEVATPWAFSAKHIYWPAVRTVRESRRLVTQYHHKNVKSILKHNTDI